MEQHFLLSFSVLFRRHSTKLPEGHHDPPEISFSHHPLRQFPVSHHTPFTVTSPIICRPALADSLCGMFLAMTERVQFTTPPQITMEYRVGGTAYPGLVCVCVWGGACFAAEAQEQECPQNILCLPPSKVGSELSNLVSNQHP